MLDIINFIPEQFTVKAHPALFEGEFDLSAPFDTVDHSILLRRLEISFGIRGVALEWFSSYLTGRSIYISCASVYINIVCSNKAVSID